MIETRLLSETEIGTLGALFETERRMPGHDLYQHRPDFLRIYAPLLKAPPVYLGAFIGGELAAASGSVPQRAHSPWPGLEAHLDTDLFAHPEKSTRAALRALLEARFSELAARPAGRFSLLFGVEQKPGALAVCSRIGRAFGARTVFPFRTRLEQIFLTAPPPVSTLARPSGGVGSVPLAAAETSVRRAWLERLGAEAAFLSPLIDERALDALAALDPEARLFYDSALDCGVCLFTQSAARRFLLTGRPTLVLERLKRLHPGEIAPGRELRLALASLVIGAGRPGFRRVLSAALNHAWARRFHCVSVRDLPPGLAASVGGTDIAAFERRVFLIHRTDATFAADLEKRLAENSLSTRLDPGFL